MFVLNKLEDSEYEKIFYKYIELGSSYIKFIYSKYIIENDLVNELKNDEELINKEMQNFKKSLIENINLLVYLGNR